MAPSNQNKDTSSRDPLPPIDRKSVESGLVSKIAVSEARRPETSVEESINFNFDTIGSATVRTGITLLGNNLGSAITGMHYFVDTINNGLYTKMIVSAGNTVYYLNGTTYVPIRSNLVSSSNARYCTYLNYTFMTNTTDATAVWDGNPSGGFVTSGNALGAPSGSCIENFRGRMWISGNATYPDRLFYSSIPTSVVTPVILWDTNPATGLWIDIAPSDGEKITALKQSKTTMLVFKTNHLYRVFDVGQTDPDPYYAVGTSSQESVIETKKGIYFHHGPSGIYLYDAYNTLTNISLPIRDILFAVPVSNYSKVTAWLEPDGDHICWMLGTVTVRGITYQNLTIRYTISTMVWTHYSYPYQFVTSLRKQPLYTDGIRQYNVVGDTLGNVFQVGYGKTDNGNPIPYSLIHRWEMGEGLISTRDTVMVANFSHYGGFGSNIMVQTEEQDPDDLNNWTRRVGQLSKSNTGFNSINVKSRKFRFRIAGNSLGEPFQYNGYELLGVLSEFIQFPNIT